MPSQPIEPVSAADARLLARIWDASARVVEPFDAVDIARRAAAADAHGTGLLGRITRPTMLTAPERGGRYQRRSRPMLIATRLIGVTAIASLGAGALLFSAGGPSPAPFASPSPTPWTPRAGWVTQEVEPGVFRVLDDGAGHDLVEEPPVDLTIAPNGEIVLFGMTPPGSVDWYQGVDTVYVLGHDAAAYVPGSESDDISMLMWFEAAVDHEGSLWAKLEATCCEPGNRLGRYDGLLGQVDTDAWTRPTWPDGSDRVNSIEVTDDGTVWLTQDSTGPGPKVARIKDGEWTVLPVLGDGSIAGRFQGDSLAAAPDGTAWLSTGSNSNPVADLPGLLHFDGERWAPVEPPIDPRFEFIGPIGRGAEGTLWVYAAEPTTKLGGLNPADTRLLRLRDGGWTVFEDVPVLTSRELFGARFEVDADGTLWIAFQGPPIIRLPAALDPARPISTGPGVLAFDGSRWRQYLDGRVVNRVAVAPDGSVWATSLGDDGGLYVITPEAVAGTE